MPTTYEGEVLFSTRELSQVLSIEDMSRTIKVTEDDVTKFILEKDFARKELNGGLCLKGDTLGDFFNHLMLRSERLRIKFDKF